MTFEEMQAMQQMKTQREFELIRHSEEIAEEHRQYILSQYGLLGEVNFADREEVERKDTFNHWVKKYPLLELEEKIKEYKYFYEKVLSIGVKNQKPFSWQTMTDVLLKYDRKFVHRMAKTHLKLTKKLIAPTKEKMKVNTTKSDDLQKELIIKKSLVDKITKEMMTFFKKKNEKVGGKLKLDDSKAKEYLENTLELYTLLAGEDGNGELAPVFDSVIHRTQDFWKDAKPQTLKALLNKLTTNLNSKGEQVEALTTQEIISLAKKCGTFFKECDAKRLDEVAQEFARFKKYILDQFKHHGGSEKVYEDVKNLTFKDTLLQAPTIGCKDRFTIRFNLDLLMGKAFHESMKDAKIKTDEVTHYLFKEFSNVKVNGTHTDLADLLINAPTSTCVSPYTIVDVVNYVDKVFKNSRYGHSNIKQELLTVANYSDLNFVRTKNFETDNCLPKLTTLFREDKLLSFLKKDLTVLNLKEKTIVDKLTTVLKEHSSQATIETLITEALKEEKGKKVETNIVPDDYIFIDGTEISKERKSKRYKEIELKMTLEDYIALLDGLEFSEEEKEKAVATFKEVNKEYLEKLEKERLEAEAYEKGFAQLLLEEEEIRLADERIQREQLEQQRLQEEAKGKKNEEEDKALKAADDIVAALDSLTGNFDKEAFDQLSYEQKVAKVKRIALQAREIKQMYVVYGNVFYRCDLTPLLKEHWTPLKEIEKYAVGMINAELSTLEQEKKLLLDQRSKLQQERNEVDKLISKYDECEKKIACEFLNFVCERTYLSVLEQMDEERKKLDEEIKEIEEESGSNAKDALVEQLASMLGVNKLNRRAKRKAFKRGVPMVDTDRSYNLDETVVKKVFFENEKFSEEELNSIRTTLTNCNTFTSYCTFQLKQGTKKEGLTVACTISSVLPKPQLQAHLRNYQQRDVANQKRLDALYDKKDAIGLKIDGMLSKKFPNKIREEAFRLWDLQIKEFSEKIDKVDQTLLGRHTLKQEADTYVDELGEL